MVLAVAPRALADREGIFDNPDEVSGLNTFCPLTLHGPLFRMR